MPVTVLLWDIDGTLLTTLKAGIKAWEDAAREVLGWEADLETMPTSGLTDPMIARQIVELAGHPADPDVERRLGEVYVERLPGRLTERQGRALPGVVDVLRLARDCDETALGLLTGNFRGGARAKLERYGLAEFFEFGGFGDDGYDRVDIGRAALAEARAKLGDGDADGESDGGLDLDRVFLMGDSPYDVECATALGLRMVALATGVHTLHELHCGELWWALDQLPPAAEFAERLALTAAPAGTITRAASRPPLFGSK